MNRKGSTAKPRPKAGRMVAPLCSTAPRLLLARQDIVPVWENQLGGLTFAVGTERWREEPKIAVDAIGTGLRALHDRLPVEECPFSWTAADRVRDAQLRSRNGLIDPAGWHDDHRHLSTDNSIGAIDNPPPVDQLVVCHGDACAPNTLLSADGGLAGHVDFGALGVADHWADLAVATWSIVWNYGPAWEHRLLDAYGIDPDPERTAYCRLLWDLGP